MKSRLGEEAVVEPHAAADAIAAGAEAQAGDDDEVDEIDGHGLAGDRLADARAGGGHAGLEAGDLDRQHAALVPAYLGDDDRLARLPQLKGERRGVDLGWRAQVEHDDAGGSNSGWRR